MCEGGQPDLYEQKLLTIRTPHRCIECGILSPKNTRMYRVKSLSEGHWDRHYTCVTCEAIKKHIKEKEPDADICHGELVEILLDQYLDDSWDVYVTKKEPRILPKLDKLHNGYLRVSIINAFLDFCGLAVEWSENYASGAALIAKR